ncbi:MAG: hypothetical protein IPL61_27215 [Myxococcales bacterium]|nr:hypothetical protein [Myxococcales bacterium]
MSACGAGAPRARPPSNAARADRPPAPAAPPEPWFHDKAEAFDECVAPEAAPAVALPPPFERCDGTEESWSSPPGGGELHFHYREFSAAVTNARRAGGPEVCCYLIWEFPRRSRSD